MKKTEIKGAVRALIYVHGFEVGGIETYLLNLIRRLSRNKNIEITLMCRVVKQDTELFSKLSSYNIRIITLGIPHLNAKTAVRFARGVDEVLRKENFDVLHMHSWKEPYVICSAKRHGVRKIILHIHVATLFLYGGESNRIIKKIVKSNNIKKANLIMAPSKDIFEKDSKLLKSKEKVIAPNCIDTVCYAYDEEVRALERKTLQIAEDEIAIGHVGRFAEVKNHRFLVDVFARVCNKVKAKLVLIGEGPLLEEIKGQVNEYGLGEKVIFLGRRDDVNRLLNALDVFVFPSFSEGLGIAVIEAQCNGLPCVISDTISDDAVVTDLVIKRSIKESAEKWGQDICEIGAIENRERYAQLVREAGYGIDAIAKQVETAYLER